jgi:hypothetical protein
MRHRENLIPRKSLLREAGNSGAMPLFPFGAPSMGALLWVKVPPQADHSERSEAQLHEGDQVWEGSVEHKS